MSNVETILRQFVQEIEEINIERDEVSSRIKLKYKDVQSAGFNPKVVRKLISLRAMDPEKREEERSLLEAYSAALGEDLA